MKLLGYKYPTYRGPAPPPPIWPVLYHLKEGMTPNYIFWGVLNHLIVDPLIELLKIGDDIPPGRGDCPAAGTMGGKLPS